MSAMMKIFVSAAASKTQILLGVAVLTMTVSISAPDAEAKQLRARGATQALTLKAPGSGPVKDTYCGGPGQVKCDDIFRKTCLKADNGHLSPSGTTCWSNVW